MLRDARWIVPFVVSGSLLFLACSGDSDEIDATPSGGLGGQAGASGAGQAGAASGGAGTSGGAGQPGAGTGGSGGTAGKGGNTGTAGTAGTAGKGGSAGTAGTAGKGGTAGQAGGAGKGGGGSGGAAGQAGASGAAGVSGWATSDPKCAASCKHLFEAGCAGTVTPKECLADCNGTLDDYPTCVDAAHALLDCQTAGQITCLPGGGATSSPACAAEGTKLAQCTVCLPRPGDSLCAACSKASCCAEGKAFVEAPGFAEFSQCEKACAGAAPCLQACKAAQPSAGAAFDKVTACASAACPVACKSGAPGDDALSLYCKQDAASACPAQTSVDACIAGIASAASLACGGAIYGQLACIVDKGITCEGGKQVTDPACKQVGETCGCTTSASADGTSCSEHCPKWGTDCTKVDGGYACTCTKGLGAGKTFTQAGTCSSAASAGQTMCPALGVGAGGATGGPPTPCSLVAQDCVDPALPKCDTSLSGAVCMPDGIVAVGASCNDGDCKKGAICASIGLPTIFPGPGFLGAAVCRATCSAAKPCADPAMFCASATPVGLCVPACKPLSGDCVGGTCARLEYDPSFSSHATCRPVGPGSVGDPCSNDQQCGKDQLCMAVKGSSACRALCDATHPCASGSCSPVAGSNVSVCAP